MNTTRDDISDENVINPREIMRVVSWFWWQCRARFEYGKVRKMKRGLDSTSK